MTSALICVTLMSGVELSAADDSPEELLEVAALYAKVLTGNPLHTVGLANDDTLLGLSLSLTPGEQSTLRGRFTLRLDGFGKRSSGDIRTKIRQGTRFQWPKSTFKTSAVVYGEYLFVPARTNQTAELQLVPSMFHIAELRDGKHVWNFYDDNRRLRKEMSRHYPTFHLVASSIGEASIRDALTRKKFTVDLELAVASERFGEFGTCKQGLFASTFISPEEFESKLPGAGQWAKEVEFEFVELIVRENDSTSIELAVLKTAAEKLTKSPVKSVGQTAEPELALQELSLQLTPGNSRLGGRFMLLVHAWDKKAANVRKNIVVGKRYKSPSDEPSASVWIAGEYHFALTGSGHYCTLVLDANVAHKPQDDAKPGWPPVELEPEKMPQIRLSLGMGPSTVLSVRGETFGVLKSNTAFGLHATTTLEFPEILKDYAF